MNWFNKEEVGEEGTTWQKLNGLPGYSFPLASTPWLNQQSSSTKNEIDKSIEW
jgi:hypothetical protein